MRIYTIAENRGAFDYPTEAALVMPASGPLTKGVLVVCNTHPFETNIVIEALDQEQNWFPLVSYNESNLQRDFGFHSILRARFEEEHPDARLSVYVIYPD